MQTKVELRTSFRARRRALSSLEQQCAAQAVLEIILRENLLANKQHIACYQTRDGELDTAPLIAYLQQAHKNIYFPQVLPDDTLVFSHAPDLVFVPLVAFDRKGNRLGMGKGCYDRTFSAQSVPLIGLAHACQEADVLPVDEWDVPLKAIITNEEYITH